MSQFGDITLKKYPGTANEVNFSSALDGYQVAFDVSYKRTFTTDSGVEKFTQPIRRHIVRFRLVPKNINDAMIDAIRDNLVAEWQFSTPFSDTHTKTKVMRIVSISPVDVLGTGILGSFYSGLDVVMRAVESGV